jgi:integrase
MGRKKKTDRKDFQGPWYPTDYCAHSKKHKGDFYQGVRYRLHETRKYNGEPDKYFVIRYMHAVKQKQVEEGLGWASEGWSAKKASEKRSEFSKANRTGTGAATLRQKRAEVAAAAEAERIKAEQAEKENTTVADFFNGIYLPVAETHKKKKTIYDETLIFKNWLAPALGKLPIKDVAKFHIEKLKKKMLDAGKAPRSVQYTFAIFRQVWNHAQGSGLVSGKCPTATVKTPRIDNRRTRYLTREQAAELLAELCPISQQVHDVALLSLHTGMRAGEVFSLTWGHVDAARGQISIVDTKSGRNRTAYMTDAVRAMFTRLYGKGQDSSALVFPDTKGGRIKAISKTFDKTVKALGLNEGVNDPRQRVVFHTLRHTFASWLVENGTNLFTVRELLGHSTIAMTERYSHVSAGALKAAVKQLENGGSL